MAKNNHVKIIIFCVVAFLCLSGCKSTPLSHEPNITLTFEVKEKKVLCWTNCEEDKNCCWLATVCEGICSADELE